MDDDLTTELTSPLPLGRSLFSVGMTAIAFCWPE